FFSSPTPGAPNPAVVAPNTTVVINEIFALNLSKKEFLTNGTDIIQSTPDWVEFYNSTTNVIDMADMSLTDNPLVPRKFIFPAGSTVAPLGFRTVKCDPDIPAGTNNAG